jgi:S-layer protein
MTIQAVANIGKNNSNTALDATGVVGLTTLNTTKSVDVDLVAADTTDVNVSGATGNIVVDGGEDVSVTDNTDATAITIGGTTAPVGTITVTDTKQGGGNIAVDGGTDVTVNNTNGTGTTTIGAGTEATGAVIVNSTLESGGAAMTGGAIVVTGGTTIDVTVNATNTADASTDTGALAAGAVKATAGDTTTDINIIQNLTNETFTKAASGQVTETASVKFGVLKDGDVLNVGSLVNNIHLDALPIQG